MATVKKSSSKKKSPVKRVSKTRKTIKKMEKEIIKDAKIAGKKIKEEAIILEKKAEKKAKQIHDKISHLPVDRRVVFFFGLIILVGAIIDGFFGKIILFILGSLAIYTSYCNKDLFRKFFPKESSKKNTKSKK